MQQQNHDALYIDGRWVPPAGRGSFTVTNASTEDVIGRVPAGDAADAARAVDAAVRAFPTWSARPLDERAALLGALAAKLEERATDLATTIAAEVGTPLKLATAIQVGGPIKILRASGDFARAAMREEEVGNSLVVREPVGVVACITPWNYPLLQVVQKVGAALAAGCTVVLKPSEVAPLSAFAFAQAAHDVGLPAGVFNLVSGDGPTVGEALVADPRVDMVSFTGSTRAGRRVAELAARGVKRVALELGGKSASVILDDVDGELLERAVKSGVSSCFLNSGQTCSALTRMLAPRAKHDAVVALAKAAAEKFTVGDALEGKARLGPLVSAAQRDRARALIEKGVAEGARLVTGGAAPPAPKGYFVQPTVFADVKPDATIAQEEIFGPVLCILPYEDEDDAVRIANGTPYGLGGGVWSKDPERALRVARRLRTGQVEVNGGAFNADAPFGGYKQSGYGREGGRHGVEEFLQTKAIQR